MHSCGSVYSIIPDYIEMGVDALNPVQTAARDMALPGSSGSSAKTSPSGAARSRRSTSSPATADEIRDHVRQNMEILMPGGGFVFAGTHNITPETDPAKGYAVYQAAKEFRCYPN